MTTNTFCRFKLKDNPLPLYGLVVGDEIFQCRESNDFFDNLNSSNEIAELFDMDSALNFSDLILLPPSNPTKIVCVGRNYKEHAEELGNKMPEEPLLFLKAPSSLIATEDSISLPLQSNQVEHEGEIGVVIGRTVSLLTDSDNPLDYVLGYTCVNDVTARDLQRKDVQFTRGKSFDTFCPAGPYIVKGLDAANLNVTTFVNGVVKQHANSSDMAFPIAEIIRYVSNIMTLYPGDLIATGTPAGVSVLKAGDIVEVSVDGVGVLRNPVKNRS